MVVPFGRAFVEHHDALKSKAKLHEASLAKIGSQPTSVFKVLVAGEFGAAQALNHPFQLFLLKLPGIHSQKGRTGGFREFHKIFPTVAVVAGLPHDRLDLFMVNVSRETAHAMAFDEGDHVIFHGCEIVGEGGHRSEHCMPVGSKPSAISYQEKHSRLALTRVPEFWRGRFSS